jgi:hypothetical protein
LEGGNLVLADTAVIDAQFETGSGHMTGKGAVSARDVQQFIEMNSERLDMEDPEVGNDLTVKSVMGLTELKGAFLSDFDDEFNETSLVYGIGVYP